MLRKAGFFCRSAKGSHTIWEHPDLPTSIVLSGGDTYEEAARNGQEVIELWIDASEASGHPIPPPRILVSA